MGRRVVTWVSPTGKQAQLDYVLWPATLAQSSKTLGNPWRGEVGNGLDHRPLLVDTCWCAGARPTIRQSRFDVAKMATPEGQAILAHIHSSVPSIPWAMDVDDHLQVVNDHIHTGLVQHFSATASRPRQAHISPCLWQAVLQSRHARRLITRSRRLRQRELLSCLFRCWRRMGAPPNALSHHKACQRQHRSLILDPPWGCYSKPVRIHQSTVCS